MPLPTPVGTVGRLLHRLLFRDVPPRRPDAHAEHQQCQRAEQDEPGQRYPDDRAPGEVECAAEPVRRRRGHRTGLAATRWPPPRAGSVRPACGAWSSRSRGRCSGRSRGAAAIARASSPMASMPRTSCSRGDSSVGRARGGGGGRSSERSSRGCTTSPAPRGDRRMPSRSGSDPSFGATALTPAVAARWMSEASEQPVSSTICTSGWRSLIAAAAATPLRSSPANMKSMTTMSGSTSLTRASPASMSYATPTQSRSGSPRSPTLSRSANVSWSSMTTRRRARHLAVVADRWCFCQVGHVIPSRTQPNLRSP